MDNFPEEILTTGKDLIIINTNNRSPKRGEIGEKDFSAEQIKAEKKNRVFG